MAEYSVLIRESHLDTFGHVNNASYLTLYEEARWELITKNGYGLSHIQQTGLGPVILDINIKFYRELRLREQIKITTELVEYRSRTAQLRQRMLKQDGQLASEAVFTFGLFDMVNRRLVDPTPDWLNALGSKG